MGMPFSSPTDKAGLYELFQDLTKTNPTSYAIEKYARDANNAFAQYMWLAIRSSQKWPADDTNQTDYPIITLDLVAGQQDYPFTVDGSTIPNQILDILRVEMLTSSGNWIVLDPYDQDTERKSLTQEALATGTPCRYGLLANAIWLEFPVGTNITGGLKVYFQRTPVYFLVTDTIKQAGIPDIFHEYLAYRPAYLYCVTNIPALAQGYLNFLTKMEQDIANYYFFRNKGERKNMRPLRQSNK